MSRLTRLAGGFRALVRGRRADRELDDELRAYLDAGIDDQLRAGLTREDAVRAARIELGNVEAAKDGTREVGWEATVESVGRDVCYAARLLLKAPGFAAVAVLTLSLGIGATVAIFTLVDSILLRRLPYPHSERLVEIDDTYQGRPGGVGQEEFRDWVVSADLFEGIAISEFDAAVFRPAGQIDPERIVGERVSDGFFTVLGVPPLYGRTFLPGEDGPGRANVVVLSHVLWRRSFGGDPNVVGITVTLGDTPNTIVGVMPPSFFSLYHRSAEFWRPLGYRSSGRMQHQYEAVGRLRPGVTLGEAQARMDVLARRAEAQHPGAKGWGIRVLPLGHAFSAGARTPLLALVSAVALVLLIACANVASLITVRTVSRSKEIAMRAALGATRGRLLRQLLVESALLAAIGGGLGVVLAHWILRAVVAFPASGVGLPPSIAVDARALGFSVGLTALTAMVFGLMPARRALRLDLVRACKASEAGATIDGAQQRVLRRLVVGEVALATALLITATLLTASLVRLLARDLGFSRERVLTFAIELRGARYDVPRRVAFMDDLIARLQALPGIQDAGATAALPMSGVYSGSGFEIDGRPTPAEWRQQSAQYCIVTEGYFRTMRIALLRGRGFAAREHAPVVVVSEALARRHWPGGDPVGDRIRGRGSNPWFTIVGVAADTRYGGPTAEPNPTIYVLNELAGSSSMFVAVRLAPTTEPVLPAVRGLVRQMDPSVPVTRVAMMDDLAARSVALQRLLATLLAAFAATAVALAAIGIYGVIAYSVQQRKQEMGIRLALGADARQVRNMVLWQGLRAALAGVGTGIVLALSLARLIASHLFGVTAHDPFIFISMPVVLSVVALVSVWLPARRAARVDPAVALRAE
jgi:predicted permease